MIRAVVFDLDGVIRHFPSGHSDGIEYRHHLENGILDATAFSQPLLTEATTGLISREQWICQIGQIVGSGDAANEWGEQIPQLDQSVLQLTDILRNRGITVAILTNGTDTIPDELIAQGIRKHIDRVFNSAFVGYIKPDQRIFRHVLDALDLKGPEVFFTDDSLSKLSGADELGFVTHHFQGVELLREALTNAGVL
ncbi:HAD-IA family hydrolase [Arthrobacter sp. MYb213]|uniref:HAD-IA family hydrolase n=1 Tax=Arthrobacter sp. MYb213 TaxID=1848595 RepID=UPI000CFCFF4A|nr:HAD-IA family hydrolase [Arthrobacter sp. MYb213]PRB67614.1 haloacid dehalogenase [Arthrobacter sp. MYb213]